VVSTAEAGVLERSLQGRSWGILGTNSTPLTWEVRRVGYAWLLGSKYSRHAVIF
jgi:hypothetical protein